MERTDEQRHVMNVAAAEVCGQVADYCADEEAADGLLLAIPDDLTSECFRQLCIVVNGGIVEAFHATPAQIVEAALRTLGKYDLAETEGTQ